MEKLPDNWKELSIQEKKIFFARNYLNYIREGEDVGLYDWTPEDVRRAYEEMLEEEKNGEGSSV